MRGEVGGDDSRQLVFIAVGDEVEDGTSTLPYYCFIASLSDALYVFVQKSELAFVHKSLTLNSL